MDLVDRKPGCNPVGNRLHVAGQHDGLLHSERLQLLKRLLRTGFYAVGYRDVTHICGFSVGIGDRDMNDRSAEPALVPIRADLVHQFTVSDPDGSAVNRRPDAASGKLRNLGNA